MDVAISGNGIARVAPEISAKEAKKSVNVAGLYVTPGLVDLHSHVFIGARESVLFPDDSALVAGTTTVCDAGISGWRTFDDFKATIITTNSEQHMGYGIVGLHHYDMIGSRRIRLGMLRRYRMGNVDEHHVSRANV